MIFWLVKLKISCNILKYFGFFLGGFLKTRFLYGEIFEFS
jgi:hypothetical protein